MGLYMTLSFLFLLISFHAKAASINGSIERDSSKELKIRLLDSMNSSFLVHTFEKSVESILNKLDSGDVFQGSGYIQELPNGQQVLLLESIDFVGIRNLLGTWVSNSTLVDFQNFNTVRFQIQSDSGATWSEFTYSLGPSESSGWMIFLRGPYSVSLGSIDIKKGSVTIEFISPKSASVLFAPFLKLTRLHNSPDIL
jgi:hypothetical protein